MEGCSHQHGLNAEIIQLNGDEFWPLSGKPYFHILIFKTHLQFDVMAVPAKIHPLLPSQRIPTSIMYQGKEWKMMYYGEQKVAKRFTSGWRGFVTSNNLKIGDACVFELIENSSEKLKFRAQILRNDLPSELASKMNRAGGESFDIPILID